MIEVREKQVSTVRSHLYEKSKTFKPIETENSLVVVMVGGHVYYGRGELVEVVKRYRGPVISSEDVIHNTVTIVNHTVWCI